ncbi:MAG: hypothetical protein ACM31L_03460 [Actinomycetota bacterium]
MAGILQGIIELAPDVLEFIIKMGLALYVVQRTTGTMARGPYAACAIAAIVVVSALTLIPNFQEPSLAVYLYQLGADLTMVCIAHVTMRRLRDAGLGANWILAVAAAIPAFFPIAVFLCFKPSLAVPAPQAAADR